MSTGCILDEVPSLALPQSLRQLTLSEGCKNITPEYLKARQDQPPRLAPELVFTVARRHRICMHTQVPCCYCYPSIVSEGACEGAHDMQAFPLLSIALMEVGGIFSVCRSEVGAASDSHPKLLPRGGRMIDCHHQCPTLAVIDCTDSSYVDE